jgi:SAM-dependent methyltransferase
VKDTRRYYDDFALVYERERHHGYHAMIDRLSTAAVAPFLPERERVLEAGCGTGLILRRLGPNAVGADLSRGMVKKARERGLCVVQASVVHLPFRDGAFAGACSLKVLAHVPAVREALAELARVVRPGAHVALEFYNRRSLRYLAWRFRRGRIAGGTTEKDVFTRWDDAETIRSYLPADLRPVTTRGIRVLTPVAALLRVPGLRRAIHALESWAAAAPLLRGWGGFLLLVTRKQ